MKIASASAYLEVLSEDLFLEFESNGFKCDDNNTFSSVDCYRQGQCSEIVENMPPFMFNTTDSSGYLV